MRVGLLLVNLGTPASPSAADVRRYLREFLSDPLVIDASAPVRWLAVAAAVLFRAPRSAAAYAKVWTPQGSPLLVNGWALRDAVAERVGAPVELAMRYGEPSIEAALRRLAASPVQRILVLPLFPQYASSSTGSALARVLEVAARLPGVPPIEALGDFYAEPGFIGAVTEVAAPRLAAFGADHVLFSYHGLPERQIRKADAIGSRCLQSEDCCAAVVAANRHCYRAHCAATSRALAAALGLADDAWTMAFQSRLGFTPWIRPYTPDVLQELAGRGVKRLAVLCPSFVADCLETLEEIGIRGREQWRELGGEALELVPCVNAHARWADTVAAWLQRAGARE